MPVLIIRSPDVDQPVRQGSSGWSLIHGIHLPGDALRVGWDCCITCKQACCPKHINIVEEEPAGEVYLRFCFVPTRDLPTLHQMLKTK